MSYSKLNVQERIRDCQGLQTETLWAAAAYAWRINGSNIKFDIDEHVDINGDTHPAKDSNKRLALRACDHPSLLSDEDIEIGELMHQHFKGLTFKAITGKLNSFEKGILDVVEIDDWKAVKNIALPFGILMSLPGVYGRDVDRQMADEKIRNVHSQHMGAPGNKVELSVRIVRSVFSSKWDCYFVTAIVNNSPNVVFFSQRRGIEVGKSVNIKGRIKAHREQGQTQLNYVRLQK